MMINKIEKEKSIRDIIIFFKRSDLFEYFIVRAQSIFVNTTFLKRGTIDTVFCCYSRYFKSKTTFSNIIVIIYYCSYDVVFYKRVAVYMLQVLLPC